MIKYKIALINVFWSEDDQNTRYFDSLNEQEIYFDNKASGHTSPLVNYNMGNNINTTVVYKDTTTRRPEEIIKSNYAIVYTVNVGENNTETIVNRRYFFAYCRQDSGRQMIVDLSLDDVQTNYFRYKVNYDKAVIKRACLPRFKHIDGYRIAFDIGTQDSILYEPENIEEPNKRLIKRTSLNFEIDTTPAQPSPFNQFFNDNIVGWEYVYLTPFGGGQDSPRYWNLFDVEALNNGQLTPKDLYIQPLNTYCKENDGNFVIHDNTYLESNQIKGALICLCAPVYKSDSHFGKNNVLISVDNNDNYPIALSTKGLNMFLSNNNNNAYVYARKFSLRPPFFAKEWEENNDYYYDSSNNTLNIKGVTSTAKTYRGFGENNCVSICSGLIEDTNTNTYYRQGCIVVLQDTNSQSFLTQDFQIDDVHRTTFNLNELIEQPKNYIFNPKLLSSQFYELNLTLFSQNYKYDPLKIGGESFKFEYNEALTPDITKAYARLNGHKGLYIDKTADNLTGLVVSNDQSLMVANDKLSEMLANNKNYYLQQGLNIGTNFLANMGKGNIVGAFGGAGSSLFKTYYLDYDNMRASPSQIKNANGNVYFATQIQPFKLAVEEYDILPLDKEKFNDYCVLYGFSLNKLDTLANYLNIRFYFNYIEADLIGVTAPISNEEKGRIRAKFEGGIRFWNTDMIDYSKENYENELLDWREEVENEQI